MRGFPVGRAGAGFGRVGAGVDSCSFAEADDTHAASTTLIHTTSQLLALLGGLLTQPHHLHATLSSHHRANISRLTQLQVRSAAPIVSIQARTYAEKATPTEVSSILEQRIRGVQEEANLAETGRVLSVGYV